MPDVFTKAKRSQVMSRIRSRGNKDTELALIRVFRAHRITGWRRHVQLRLGRARSPLRAAIRFRRRGAHGVTRPTKDRRWQSTATTATPLNLSGQTGFCFSQAQARSLRGRLFLAQLSQARHQAQEQRIVLAQEAGVEQGAGSVGEPHIASQRLAGVAHLGT